MRATTNERGRGWPRGRESAARSAASALFLALALVSCSDSPAERPNVLWVISDTTRADRMGCLGNERGLTPFVDELAASGVRYDAAYSHAPWTLPSTASMFTSLHPTEHGAGGQVSRFTALDEDAVTVAEVFRDAGWRTGAVVNVDFLTERFGLTRGFDWVDEKWFPSNRDVRRAKPTTDSALSWLESGAEPFFLLVHYFDPHAVYDPPEEWRRRFAAPQDRADDSFTFGTREDMMALRAGRLALDPATIDRAAQLYDGEVAFTDAQFGRLLEHLDASGLADRTVVVFTADHGEEFLDHGGFEHGHSMFDELLHVPLVLRWPGGPAGRVVSETVRHIDLAPTLCELAGLQAPASFVGASLLDVTRDRPVLAHGNFWGRPRTALLSDGFKLIVDAERNDALYDMDADPGEQVNLGEQRPDRLATMLDELRAFEQVLQAAADRGAVELSEEELEKLRDLGYAGDEDAAPPR